MKKHLAYGLFSVVMACQDWPSAQSPSVSCNIPVQGPEAYAVRMKQALRLIQNRDPENWSMVCHNVTLIRYHPPSGIYVHNGIIHTDENETLPGRYYQPMEWVAGEIVHDAWHREYFRRGEAWDGWKGEKKCMERQNEFFLKIGYPQLDVEDTLKTRYWEIERDW